MLLNSRFNVSQLPGACLGTDMWCGLTPIIHAQSLLACPLWPDPCKGSRPCGQTLVAHCWHRHLVYQFYCQLKRPTDIQLSLVWSGEHGVRFHCEYVLLFKVIWEWGVTEFNWYRHTMAWTTGSLLWSLGLNKICRESWAFRLHQHQESSQWTCQIFSWYFRSLGGESSMSHDAFHLPVLVTQSTLIWSIS